MVKISKAKQEGYSIMPQRGSLFIENITIKVLAPEEQPIFILSRAIGINSQEAFLSIINDSSILLFKEPAFPPLQIITLLKFSTY